MCRLQVAWHYSTRALFRFMALSTARSSRSSSSRRLVLAGEFDRELVRLLLLAFSERLMSSSGLRESRVGSRARFRESSFELLLLPVAVLCVGFEELTPLLFLDELEVAAAAVALRDDELERCGLARDLGSRCLLGSELDC